MGTHYHGTEQEVQALNAYIVLLRAAESISSRVSNTLCDAELTVSQFGVLEALYHLGPLNQSQLCAKLLKSSGNITLVVNNVARRALARRERYGRDRRFVMVHLTDKGRHLVEQVMPSHVAAIVEEMRTLDPGEQETLRQLCRRLGRKERQEPGP